MMKQAFLQLKTRFPQAVALLLCVWLSGVTCILCCETLSINATSTDETEISKLPPCHQKLAREEEKKPKLQTPKDSSAIKCCPLAWQIYNKASKIQQVEKVADEAVKESFDFTPKVTRLQISFQSNYEPFPQNRSGTYLLNCVFRI